MDSMIDSVDVQTESAADGNAVEVGGDLVAVETSVVRGWYSVAQKVDSMPTYLGPYLDLYVSYLGSCFQGCMP